MQVYEDVENENEMYFSGEILTLLVYSRVAS